MPTPSSRFLLAKFLGKYEKKLEKTVKINAEGLNKV